MCEDSLERRGSLVKILSVFLILLLLVACGTNAIISETVPAVIDPLPADYTTIGDMFAEEFEQLESYLAVLESHLDYLKFSLDGWEQMLFRLSNV